MYTCTHGLNPGGISVIAGYFRGSKFRFSIDIAQTPPMTINVRELNIRGMALYHEKHENIMLYGSTRNPQIPE